MIQPPHEFVVEPLNKTHDFSSFDCGKAALNDWLARFALQNQYAGGAKVYVAQVHDGIVLGYYALVASSVERADAPARVGKGLSNQPVGVILLARLAVDRRAQGRALGKALLLDALMRTS